MKKLFVAFSHTLSPSQKKGWDEIVNLGDVSPELQAKMSKIPADATLSEIQKLAVDIVQTAICAKCTHFFCTGEPTLTMWANLIASGEYIPESGANNTVKGSISSVYMSHMHYGANRLINKVFVCVQSTTERVSTEVANTDGTVTKTQVFKHVQWRNMF